MESGFKRVDWLSATNVYEVNLRQYTQEGSFSAFQHHLHRLKDMGVDVLWFMPVTPISKKNRKGSLGSFYACSSYTMTNPEFGSLDDFANLVDAAHALGMKVIIDWVSNHTGCDHEWTRMHPSFYKRNEEGQCYDAHGWDDVIDLDYNNEQMRDEMIRSMGFWIDRCGIDGFRCDMAMLTPVDFWRQARAELEKKKVLFWLAELDPLDHPHYMDVFDTAYTWRWMHATKHFRDEGARTVHQLREVLGLYAGIAPRSLTPCWFTSNHDENAWNGTEYEKYGEMAVPMAVFSGTWKGLPLLYSGQEIPNNKRLAFFDKDQLHWEKEPLLHGFYKKLFALRKEHPAFHGNPEEQQCTWTWNSVDHHVFSFIRSASGEAVLILINLSGYPLHNVEVDTRQLNGVFKEYFSSSVQVFSGNSFFHLPPWGYQVWINR